MQKNREKTINATFMTDYGSISMQADENGLTNITLPRPPHHRSIPGEELMPDNSILQNAARQINEYLQGTRKTFDVPLTVIGTDFQKRVWEIIRKIPYGQTLSYGDIARHLGGTGKARAVGGAAHANPLPLVIPCHRVIGTNGSLTGFGGGLYLKKKLLELEKMAR